MTDREIGALMRAVAGIEAELRELRAEVRQASEQWLTLGARVTALEEQVRRLGDGVDTTRTEIVREREADLVLRVERLKQALDRRDSEIKELRRRQHEQASGNEGRRVDLATKVAFVVIAVLLGALGWSLTRVIDAPSRGAMEQP